MIPQWDRFVYRFENKFDIILHYFFSSLFTFYYIIFENSVSFNIRTKNCKNIFFSLLLAAPK